MKIIFDCSDGSDGSVGSDAASHHVIYYINVTAGADVSLMSSHANVFGSKSV